MTRFDLGYKEGDFYELDGRWYVFRPDGNDLHPFYVGSGSSNKPVTGRHISNNVPRLQSKPVDVISGGGPVKNSVINLQVDVNGTPDTVGTKSLRWPDLAYTKNTDFVFFEFGKYIPPFGKDRSGTKGGGYEAYDENNKLQDVGAKSVLLPMPQDLSSILEQNWSGKQFSRAGMAAISAMAGAGFGDLKRTIQDGKGNLTALQGALTAGALNKIPGVGGNLTTNDITGSVNGIVLNPNAELLYDQPDLREIQMTYKMVPRNEPEALKIQEIVKLFRKASVPSWGDTGATTMVERDTTLEISNAYGKDKKDIKENFISVPWLCRFKFMTGKDENQNIPKYKVCAISRVSVNYTPDGTYATYDGGVPLATEIQINFLETKAIFKRDIDKGF